MFWPRGLPRKRLGDTVNGIVSDIQSHSFRPVKDGADALAQASRRLRF